jgi:ADP-heptose:LPS heptosyltransferase
MNEWCQEEGVRILRPDPDLRTWAAIIQEADYFIGCDSCGQHMAKAVGTPASVVIAGTHEVAISYPETFHIIKREGVKFYPGPMRVSNINSMLTEKLNEERNAFTDEEIDSAYKEIVKRIGRSSNKTQPTKIEKKEDSKGFAN